MQEIAPGLLRWTAWHDHWEEDVGALAVETGDGLVFIDPIDPPVALGPPAHVLVTVYWHGRTSGELRISNFMLWQLAYAELVFVDRLWPDFDERDLRQALTEYAQRRRRFGGR